MKTKRLIIFTGLTMVFFACNPSTQPAKPTVAINMGTELHRPLFHFTPKTNWMNDPNGMAYYKGEYHLFYQHYPDSAVWGPMHWGHAVSKDLIHWERLPIALYPDSLGYIFSGSCVVDETNTSGFQKGDEKPLVAIFTYHNPVGEKAGRTDFQTQGIAYSLDKGRSWTKYAGNPVVKNPGSKDFRDPKVIWHAATKQWVMTLAVADHIAFYGSKDLKNWEKLSEFGKTEGSHGGVWECPDLFSIKADSSGAEKWVLIVNIGNGSPNGGSGTQYFVGYFNGKTFKNDNPPGEILWADYGRDNYAGVTWSGAPDGRHIFLGWMSNWRYATKVPTTAWRSATTLPRELSLNQTPAGLRLFQRPVKELESLRGAPVSVEPKDIVDLFPLSSTPAASELMLTFDLSKTTAQDFGVQISNTKKEKVTVGYEKSTNRFYVDRTQSGKMDFEKGFSGRHYAPRLSMDKSLKMHIFFDVASVELFADDGATVMTDIFFPQEDFTRLSLFSKNGAASLTEGKVWELKPALPQ